MYQVIVKILGHLKSFTLIVLKLNKSVLLSFDVSKSVEKVEHSVDPDQTLRSAASDLGLYCFIKIYLSQCLSNQSPSSHRRAIH